MFKSLMKSGLPLFFGCCLLLAGCRDKSSTNDRVLAQVGSEKLYLSEVASLVPEEVPPEDSAIMMEEYINKWLKQELLLKKAEENLSAGEKDVTKQLEEYRKSLIIYRYKNALVSQRMDTTVTNEQIREYYALHPDMFLLKKNIVKAIFLKIPHETADPAHLKNLCNNTTTEGIIEIRDYCLQYAKLFDIFTDRWVDFQTVLKNMPDNIGNAEQFLQENKMIEQKDSNYYYLVAVHDYKLKNEPAPVEYVKENIKNLLLNRRKINFLKELENNVYSEGIKKNKFKIFNREKNDVE